MTPPASRPENRFLELLKSSRSSPMIVAHRGDSFHAPENTMEAARLAFEGGAPSWELDVQLTRDGVPVILHDESLRRTTNVAQKFKNDPRGSAGYRLADFDFDEVRSLDAGSWFVAPKVGGRSAHGFGTLEKLDPGQAEHYRSGAVVVPTLQEALEYTKKQNWLVNVEIKSFPSDPAGLVDKVIAAIDAANAADHVLISAFDHRHIAAAARPGRRYGLGALLGQPVHRLADYAADLLGADTVHVSTTVLGAGSIAYLRKPAADALRRDVVADLTKRGLPCLVYTVNHQEHNHLARDLAEIGVAGWFTDDPRGMKGVPSRG